MEQKDNTDEIMAYLKGTLSMEDKKTFEKRVTQKPALKAEVEEWKLIFLGMNALEKEETILESKATLLDEIAELDKVSPRKLYRQLAIAATIIPIIFGVPFLMQSRHTNEHLLAYHQSKRLDQSNEIITLIKDEGNMKMPEKSRIELKIGYDLFLSGDCNGAIEKLTPFENQKLLAVYMLGSCEFKNKNYQTAINYFTIVAGSNFKPIKEEANWNIILAQLALNQTERTDFETRLENTIEDKSGKFSKEAELLKLKLNSFWRR